MLEVTIQRPRELRQRVDRFIEKNGVSNLSEHLERMDHDILSRLSSFRIQVSSEESRRKLARRISLETARIIELTARNSLICQNPRGEIASSALAVIDEYIEYFEEV